MPRYSKTNRPLEGSARPVRRPRSEIRPSSSGARRERFKYNLPAGVLVLAEPHELYRNDSLILLPLEPGQERRKAVAV